ncbi:hypothetical protein CEXT_505751 [Caerostris extrusa]|uniref:Uncharacterized protein n=1 Tax=Caerostris extrusa TaxID=172846 RepID=A0AAV4MIC2_CAEEX|nr:hypothetical protein CEXT_505751 [Caerostris extrusa]
MTFKRTVLEGHHSNNKCVDSFRSQKYSVASHKRCHTAYPESNIRYEWTRAHVAQKTPPVKCATTTTGEQKISSAYTVTAILRTVFIITARVSHSLSGVIFWAFSSTASNEDKLPLTLMQKCALGSLLCPSVTVDRRMF